MADEQRDKRLWCKTCGARLDTIVASRIGTLHAEVTCPHCGSTHIYTEQDLRAKRKRWWQRA